MPGLYYYTNPQPANLAITRRLVYNPNITLPFLANLAIARLNETRFQQLSTLSIPVRATLSTRSTHALYARLSAFYNPQTLRQLCRGSRACQWFTCVL